MSEKAHHQQHTEAKEELVVIEIGEPLIGVYKPTARIMGSMAASAAAQEFLRITASAAAAGDRPEPPAKPKPDEELSDEAPSAKTA